MKIKTFFAIPVVIFISAGCSNHKIDEINANITNTQTYTYDFGICGDEEGVTISVPGEHAEICEIIRDSTTFFCSLFRYKAQSGYTGTDKVEVITNTGSNGASQGDLNTVVFNFTITN